MTETVKVQRPIFPPDGPWLMTDHTEARALVERLTGFTPGPWNVGPIDDTRVEDTLGNEVAQIDGDYNQPETWPVMEANARLIAAAPDLLAALTAALDEIERLRLLVRWAFFEGYGYTRIEPGEGADMDAIFRAALLSYQSSKTLAALKGDDQ